MQTEGRNEKKNANKEVNEMSGIYNQLTIISHLRTSGNLCKIGLG